jgi:hypothetical protein
MWKYFEVYQTHQLLENSTLIKETGFLNKRICSPTLRYDHCFDAVAVKTCTSA